LTVLEAGSVWLDGGAMFGVVPKTLWERKHAPDERNRIELSMNLLLVEDGDRRTLVDTGAGCDWDDKERSIHRLETLDAEGILAPAGLTPQQIDRVVLSHLHFDHAGGSTVRGPDGEYRAAFPGAEYVVQAGELETARLGNERTRASYRPNSFEPLVEKERLRLVEGEVDLGRGVRLRPAPGHTPHMQTVFVETGEGTVVFLADLVPTASHVPFPYIMGYDLEPLRTLESKRRLLGSAAAEGWRIVFEHDARMPLGTLVEVDGRLDVRAVEGEV
jgi:glyoxylase-like metal-dependent hydrolase (beta-lactamase superfamily II)